MGTSNYSEDFKRDAVHQVQVRGYSVRDMCQVLAPDQAWVRDIIYIRIHEGWLYGGANPGLY